jgi:hypothetical protein
MPSAMRGGEASKDLAGDSQKKTAPEGAVLVQSNPDYSASS